jgi:cytochrome c oxidase subunit 2
VPVPPPEAPPLPHTWATPLPKLTPAPGVPGDVENGRRLFTGLNVFVGGCGGCHTVQGLPGATGYQGPNLTNVALRPTLAGDAIPNSPQALRDWIMDPPTMKTGAVMPKLNVTSPGGQEPRPISESEARDLAAFLYSLPYNTAASRN